MLKHIAFSLLATDVIFASSGSGRLLMQAPPGATSLQTTLAAVVTSAPNTPAPVIMTPTPEVTTAVTPAPVLLTTAVPVDPVTVDPVPTEPVPTDPATTAVPVDPTATPPATLIPEMTFVPVLPVTTNAVPVTPVTTASNTNVQTTAANQPQTTNPVPPTTANPVTEAPVNPVTTAVPVDTVPPTTVAPVDPVTTTAPVVPVTTSAVPVDPVTTAAPVDPVTTQKVTTAAPVNPVTTAPVDPVTTAAPVDPVTTAAPVTPVTTQKVTTSAPVNPVTTQKATTAVPVDPATTPSTVMTTPHPGFPAVTTSAPAPTVPVVVTPVPTTPFPTEPVTPSPNTPAPTDPLVTPPAGYLFGAFDQLCEATQSVMLSKCTDITQSTSDGGSGHLFCNSFESDCCLCNSIQCGFEGRGCNQALFGKQSAFGVKDVAIRGAPRGLGAMVMCHGEESCRESVIDGTNVDSVNCNGYRSCQGAKMVITDPKPNFLLDCSGFSSCEDLEIEIRFSGPPAGYMCAVDADPTLVKDIFSIGAIECENEAACKGMKLTINNEGCTSVQIRDLRCLEYDSCSLADFQFIGDVSLNECRCGPSCAEATGLSKCHQNLDKVTCNDPQICMDQTRVITNPRNHFQFECGNIESCMNIDVRFELTADLNRPRPITIFDGLVFGGVNAAFGSVFTFDNQQGLDTNVPEGTVAEPIELTVNKIECSQDGACENAVFVTGDYVTIREVNCATDACYGCLIKEKVVEWVERR